ncbi:MAG TPA: hypothetical protein VHR66_25150 [Gemmataceae bacterium]|nr:hypothetical protein [Gemmataceae bacterium]
MGSVQFAPDSRILITAGGDAVRLWDVATRSVIATLPGEHDILGIQFSRDGTVLATGGSADFVNIWDGAALLGKPDAKAGQASPPPPDIAPFIGQWEHPAFIREVWTVKYEDAKLSVSGIYYRDSVEVGSFVSKSVEFKDGTLSFEQVYVASPSPIYKDARSTLKIDPKNPDRVLRTWKNDTGSGSDAFPRMKN